MEAEAGREALLQKTENVLTVTLRGGDVEGLSVLRLHTAVPPSQEAD